MKVLLISLVLLSSQLGFANEPVADSNADSSTPPVPTPGSQMGGSCISGVAPVANCPGSIQADQAFQGPAIDSDTCKTVFPQLFSNTETPNLAEISNPDNICRFTNREMANTYAEQCVAIWHATKRMTNFVSPRGSSRTSELEDVSTAQTTREAEDIRRRNDEVRRQERQSQAAVSVNGIPCQGTSEFDLDYPACKRFVAWYNSLQLAETGLGVYNNAQQINAGQQAQQEARAGMLSGDQAAGLTGTATNLSAQAASQDRIMAFNAARAAAITAQLATFPNERNLPGKCGSDSSSCCTVFSQMNGASNYFPNAGMKATMTAEVAKALGAALAAKLAADAARKQRGIVNNIKEQIADGPTNNPGIINFCTQNPQDPRCLAAGGPGAVSPGSFGGNNFTGGDFGNDSLGFATTGDEISALDESGGLDGPDSIGGIGDVGPDIQEAKEAFNAPSAGANIGSPTGGAGGGGGGAANASAPGLSKDPGAQGDQKPADTKVTSLGAAYNGAAYSGGAFRNSANKKENAPENPFASLFGKDKERGPANVQIDAPASDLFVKISNRYNEVNKRKDLMEVK